MSCQTSRILVEELPSFTYQPLDHRIDQIRLLSIDAPNEECDDIVGRLTTVSVSELPTVPQHEPIHNGLRYCALSYEWGILNQTTPIIVDNQVLRVGCNVYEFLLKYRKHLYKSEDSKDICCAPLRSKSYIWIDQISINQNDVDERNRQVGMMHRIYSQATHVFVWLANPAVEQAIVHYRQACNAHSCSPAPARTSGCSQLGTFVGSLMVVLKIEPRRIWAQSREHLLHDLKELLSSMARASYWTRLWVQQELRLARDLVFAAGDAFIHSRELATKTSVYLRVTLPTQLGSIQRLFKSSGRLHFLPLYNTIEQSFSLRCGNPKDRIFGLMAMVLPRDRIEVDYDESVEQVFDMAVIAILGSDGCPLCCCPMASGIRVMNALEKLAKKMRVYDNDVRQHLGDLIGSTRSNWASDRRILPIEQLMYRTSMLHSKRFNPSFVESPNDEIDWRRQVSVQISRDPKRLYSPRELRSKLPNEHRQAAAIERNAILRANL